VSIGSDVAAWTPVLWFLLVAVLLLFLWRSGLLSSLIGRMKSLNAFGVQFQFDEATAKQTRDTVESGLETVRTTIQRELEADVRARSLQYGFQSLLESTGLKDIDDYRATIHIPDPLYENALYQLLDYYPRGAGHGRTFSSRNGLIGLVWRIDEPGEWKQSDAISIPVLMRDWGMTRREAAERRVVDKTKVMMAQPLHDATGSRQVGVLYLDSGNEHVFGNDDQRRQLREQLDQLFRARLAGEMSSLVEAAKRRSPQLSLAGL